MPKTKRGLHYAVTDLRPPWLQNLGLQEREPHGQCRIGRPVVFHHGVGASHDIFAEWVPIIATHHPTVAYDMRGFGQSVIPPETHAWTFDELIGDLLEVAETTFGPEPIHVIGESIGGTVALAAAIEHPTRFASVAMSNAAIKGGQIGYARGWRAEIARVGMAGWSDRMMGMRFVPGAMPPEALEWFAKAQATSAAHAVIGLGELLIATDLTAALADFKSPLLLMMPDKSPFVSLSQAGALTELVPQTELAVFPGARHGLPFSHAKQAAATLLAFLARVERGQLPPPRVTWCG